MLPVVTVIGVDLRPDAWRRGDRGNGLRATRPQRKFAGEFGLGRDYPLIQGTFVIYLAIIILVDLAVDLLYGRLDPHFIPIGGSNHDCAE